MKKWQYQSGTIELIKVPKILPRCFYNTNGISLLVDLLTDQLTSQCLHYIMHTVYTVYSRDPPIMLIILPIMLCCTAQNFAYYA